MLKLSSRLGPYEIVAALGAGGMGEVYRARDTRLGREVAVKVLLESFANDAASLARFEREARSVAALSHPNILSIHDYGTHEAITYAVMELLVGETLRDRLTKGPLPWREVIEIGAAIADGLAAAHAKGIVHRDIKPENLFLMTDGQVKVLDFGLARVTPMLSEQSQTAHFDRVETQVGVVMGTVGYMSPEQVRGQPAPRLPRARRSTPLPSCRSTIPKVTRQRKCSARPSPATSATASGRWVAATSRSGLPARSLDMRGNDRTL